MRISELATRTGVPPSTLRYYEAEGLLPADREANGYRTYGWQAIDRLAFISQAKTLDLALADIRELVTAWESEACSSVRATYRPILTERAGEVDQRIAALGALRTSLSQAIERLDALPDRDAPCDAACTLVSADSPAPLPAPASAPIMCTLTTGDDRADRIAAWHQLLAGADPIPTGDHVTVTLPIDTLAQTAALAAAEQLCCSFLDFRLDLHGSTLDLTMAAPAEAIDMLRDLLPMSGASPVASSPRTAASSSAAPPPGDW